MANWEDLSVRIPLETSSTLRVLVSSGDKVIGQTAMQRGKLLGGRRNQKGYYVVSWYCMLWGVMLITDTYLNQYIYVCLYYVCVL